MPHRHYPTNWSAQIYTASMRSVSASGHDGIRVLPILIMQPANDDHFRGQVEGRVLGPFLPSVPLQPGVISSPLFRRPLGKVHFEQVPPRQFEPTCWLSRQSLHSVVFGCPIAQAACLSGGGRVSGWQIQLERRGQTTAASTYSHAC